MDQRIQNFVQQAIDEFVTEDRMFTAYDVTLRTRDLATRAVNVRHAEVRDLVHNVLMAAHIQAGTFVKNQIQVRGEHPFLFYPPNADTSAYDPDWLKNSATTGRFARAALPAPATTPTPQLPAAAATPTPIIAGHDSRGRVCVPADLIRKLGLKTGDRAFVQVDQQMLKVSKTQPATFDVSYLVDKDDNVRVSGWIVEQANLLANQDHQFKLEGDVIEVS